MVYIEIPYVAENNRVNRISAKNEIQILKISNEAKANVFEAIYHLHPRGVTFGDNDLEQVLLLQYALRRLGIPYRRIEE